MTRFQRVPSHRLDKLAPGARNAPSTTLADRPAMINPIQNSRNPDPASRSSPRPRSRPAHTTKALSASQARPPHNSALRTSIRLAPRQAGDPASFLGHAEFGEG